MKMVDYKLTFAFENFRSIKLIDNKFSSLLFLNSFIYKIKISILKLKQFILVLMGLLGER